MNVATSPSHVATGLEYLPALARRLHQRARPRRAFDFLTWFEFAPADLTRFERLVQRLRSTEEWTYVESEIDIRLARYGHFTASIPRTGERGERPRSSV